MWPGITSARVLPVGDVEITLPNSQGNQSFRSVAGKRSNVRAVYLGDPRLALLGRSPVGAEKSALTTSCPVAAGSVFSGKVQFYGLPMFNEELERRLSTGEIVLGGCCVCEDDPIWQCLECQHSFGHRTDKV